MSRILDITMPFTPIGRPWWPFSGSMAIFRTLYAENSSPIRYKEYQVCALYDQSDGTAMDGEAPDAGESQYCFELDRYRNQHRRYDFVRLCNDYS